MSLQPERAFRILWGPTLANALDLASPADGRGIGELPTLYRQPREGSTQLVNQGATVAWVNARRFYLKFRARFVDAPHNFGAAGVMAFLDWASDGGAFTLVPNLATPALTVPGCRLEGTFVQPAWGVEQGEVYGLDLTVWHPTIDLGVSWRGLFFEYAAGGSLSDPILAAYSRSSVGYEITPAGYLLQHPANSLCDGHYPWGIGGTGMQMGIQTTLIEPAVTNDVTNPEDLTNNTSWTKTDCSITANSLKAPDGNITADLIVEDAVASVFHTCTSAAISITAGDPQTALCFVHDGGRSKGLFMFTDGSTGAGTNKVGVQFDLFAGTVTAGAAVAGSGVLLASGIVPLAGGWFMLWFRGTIGGAVAQDWLTLRLGDASGNFTYTGDGASGIWFWGCTAVHGANNNVASYTPTTSAADALALPWAPTGLGATTQQSFWFYAQWVESGAAYCGGFPVVVKLGYGNFGGAGVGVSLAIFGNKGNSGNNRYGFEAWSNGTQLFIIDDWPTTTLNFGDVLEAFGTVVWDAATNHWTASLQVAQNGAVVSTLGPTALNPLTQAFWNAPATYLGAGSGVGNFPTAAAGVAVVRAGPYVPTGPFSVQQLAIARVL